MKKYAPLLLGLIISAVVVDSAPVKNLMCGMLGYGSCPNCGNSWYWNEAGSIMYGSLEEGRDFTVTGDVSNIAVVGV